MSAAIWQKPTLGNVAMVYIYTLPHCQRGYGFEISHCICLIYSVLHFFYFLQIPIAKRGTFGNVFKSLLRTALQSQYFTKKRRL
jgi:hypothetical protein